MEFKFLLGIKWKSLQISQNKLKLQIDNLVYEAEDTIKRFLWRM